MNCPDLFNPLNGRILCSLTNDSLFSYEDTCSFTCNTGYELTGSDTRTCQSDGSWSGSDVVCQTGIQHAINDCLDCTYFIVSGESSSSNSPGKLYNM